MARANAARLGLDGIEFLEGDLLAGAEARAIDAVLSNPPYVADGDRATLAPEITRHEPPGALFAGADGLDVIRRLVPAAAAAGARLLAIELGEGQARGGRGSSMREAGFGSVEARRDLAGIERVVVGRHPRGANPNDTLRSRTGSRPSAAS